MKSLSNTEGRTLGDRLRVARRATQLSQSQLAGKLGVAASAVAQWESPSGTLPRLDKLALLAAAVGVSVDWLLTGRGLARAAPRSETTTLARDDDEQLLLRQFRRLPRRARGLVIGLVNEIGARR